MAENRADNLSPAQENAILALIAQTTVAKAAEACGVPERTLYNWLDDPHFDRAHRRARKLAFRQAIALSQRYAAMAVQTLAKVASDPNVPAAAKVSASTALLKFSRESIELDDVVERVEALEQDMKERKAS